MLKNLSFMIAVACIILLPAFAARADVPSKGPQAFLPDSTHEFGSVVEGSQVMHEFMLHNRGDEPLEIVKIASG